LMLVSVIASAIAMKYLPNSIMTEKLARRGLDIHQDYEANALKQLKVAEVMARDIATVEPQETVRVAADRFATGDLSNYRHHALPIVDSAGQLQGLVTQGDLLRALQADPAGEMPVIDAGTRSLIVAYPDERVFDAVTKMLEHNIGRLPVVDRAAPQTLVGYINRANVMGSWRGHLHEEFVREHGWFSSMRAARESRSAGIVIGLVTGCNSEEIAVRPDGDEDSPVEEFALSAPLRGVFRGDHVRINYRNEDGRKIAVRIEELSSRQ
jgi:CIC family chloride channel protein